MSKTIDLGRVVGNSAYEDAVANGYVGTLEQWLASLKGEKGDRGEQGIQGERGLQGEQGEKGDRGEQGIQGERGLQGEQGIQGVAGQNGQDGRDGTNGADGQDGVSPAVTIETIQGGHRMTVTDATHPQGQSFDVMDGQAAQTGSAVSLTFTYEDDTTQTYNLLTEPSNNS